MRLQIEGGHARAACVFEQVRAARLRAIPQRPRRRAKLGRALDGPHEGDAVAGAEQEDAHLGVHPIREAQERAARGGHAAQGQGEVVDHEDQRFRRLVRGRRLSPETRSGRAGPGAPAAAALSM